MDGLIKFKGVTEYQDFAFEVKAIEEDGAFEGYAAVYGNVDRGKDTIAPFAAKRSLKQTKGKMPILRNHSARIEDIVGENVEASEDDKGFKIKGRFDLDRQSGKDTYQAIKFAKNHGRKMGLSIGFIPNWKQVDYIDNVRILKEIHIVEYSIVVFPMNPKAQISSIKSFSKDAPEEKIVQKKREIEAVLRDVGCNQAEQKSGVAAIFALRDVSDESDAERKQKKVEEGKIADAILATATRIKEGE